eukprot:1194694-Prorocentrum_minimum.AAC.3
MYLLLSAKTGKRNDVPETKTNNTGPLFVVTRDVVCTLAVTGIPTHRRTRSKQVKEWYRSSISINCSKSPPFGQAWSSVCEARSVCKVRPTEDCAALDFCNGRGYCNDMPRCDARRTVVHFLVSYQALSPYAKDICQRLMQRHSMV